MSLMQAPPPRPSRPLPPRARGAEPGGFTLFLLFFGSLILAGLIGVWLWNSNGSVHEGRAFGTPNQLAQGGPATAAGAAGPAAAGAAAGAAAATAPDPALVSKSQQLATQFGCVACHTINGQASVGPTWKGLADSQVAVDNGPPEHGRRRSRVQALRGGGLACRCASGGPVARWPRRGRRRCATAAIPLASSCAPMMAP